GRRELVVVEHRFARDVEQRQQQSGHDAGAILARNAVKEQGTGGRVDGQLDDGTELGAQAVEQPDVDAGELDIVWGRQLAERDLLLDGGVHQIDRGRRAFAQLDPGR